MVDAGAATAIGDVEDPIFSTSNTLASKDCWVDTVAGCVGEANHNGTDLDLASATKNVYFAFDLTGLGGATTITAARLTLNVKTAPAAAADIASFGIADANEGWSETTIVCSNRPPANGASKQTLSINTATGEKVFTLNSTWITRLEERIGVGVCTFLLQMSTVSTATFESKDEGTNNNLGPRLALTFSSP